MKMSQGVTASSRVNKKKHEELFLEPVKSDHTEMYLKALWLLHEMGERPAKISSISSILNISAPSVVEMLRRLAEHHLTEYIGRKGGVLTPKGDIVGRRMVRNTRLVEALMARKFRIDVDEKVACGLEHHMTNQFSESLCILLKHPRTCPHGYSIPRGICCER